MPKHPFTDTAARKIAGTTLIALAVLFQWIILTRYGNAAAAVAFTDSAVSIGLLSAAGYFSWFVLSDIRVWQVQLSLALLVQFVCLGISFTLMTILNLADSPSFLYTLPLRFIFGFLCWIILFLWYRNLRQEEQFRKDGEEERERPERESGAPDTMQAEHIDRISVKDGSRIHIVHIKDLFCLQAGGDYVTLFTPAGQYIKEQTMKYFEQHLPSMFVRIHRSTIVNTEYIARVELFGKENYCIKLKNGVSLRASNSGYKLLKERLSL
jgi:hypothetical protein